MTKKTFVLLGFIILKFVLQYSLIDSCYDLHRDEFLYLDQAHHLAWGFLSVPPVTSWISSLIYILGGTVFWIKFFPALFGALTILTVWKACEELNGNMFALILSATGILFSTLLRADILYQPVSFDILSWTAFCFFVIKYFKTESPKWLYIAALVFGIGFLNKYNIIFLLMGFVPAILISLHRKLFVKKEFYFALILGLLLISPNLFWQYKNNFPFINHLNELTNTQLVYVSRLAFLREQVIFFFGSLFVIISALYALLFYKPFEKYRTFFWVLIFTATIFVSFKAKAYYTIGIYPIYIALGSVFLGNILRTGWRKYILFVLIILPILFFIPSSKVLFPNKTPEYIVNNTELYKKIGMLQGNNGRDYKIPQDFADMVGWKDLAIMVDSICSEMPNLDNTMILCDNYGEAGAINYYTKNKKVIAHSYNADYINWFKFDKEIIDAILVKSPYDSDKERKKEIPLFDTVYLAAKRINQYSTEDTISIYVLKGAKVDINEIIKDDIRSIKKVD